MSKQCRMLAHPTQAVAEAPCQALAQRVQDNTQLGSETAGQ